MPNSSSQASVSLVIPSYNRAALIGETIDSALVQSRPFLEIIVVDDGSTDNTAEVLARYGDKVTFVGLSHGGVQAARNRGVELARGDYIALCDSDDLLLPEFLATLASWLEADPACDAMYCNFIPFTEQGDGADKFAGAPGDFFEGARRSGEIWHDIPDLYLRTVSYQPLFPSGSVIRKSTYEAIGGYDSRFKGVGSEDWEFTLRLIASSRMALCATPLVRIRKHAGNDSTDNVRQSHGCVQILEFALQHHSLAQFYREPISRSIEQRRAGVFAGAFSQGNFALARHMLAEMPEHPRDMRFRLKAFITRLPSVLRKPLWHATQANAKASVRPG